MAEPATPVRRPVRVKLDRAATEAVRERIWQRWQHWERELESELVGRLFKIRGVRR